MNSEKTKLSINQKMEIGKRIRALRRKLEISTKDLADFLDITTSALSQYENGKRTPGVQILLHLSQTFNVTVDYILTGKIYLPLKHKLSDELISFINYYENSSAETRKLLDNGIECMNKIAF